MSNVSSSNSQGVRVPKLRFRDNSGRDYPQYQPETVGTLFTHISSRNADMTNNNVITNSAEFGLIPQREFFDKNIAVEGNTDKYYIIEQGDFVYNPRKSTTAPYGPFNCYQGEEKGIVSPLYTCLKPLQKEYADYLLWYFRSPAWYSYIYHNGAQGGARHDRVGMTNDLMDGIPVNLPSLEEQEKISRFLATLEKRIEKQRQLVELLKSYKRGFLNSYISQNEQDWNKVRLSDILTERKEYFEKDGTYPHATLSKDGVYGKTDRYDRDYLVTSDDKKYKVTHKGDLCYNPANLKFGVICINAYGDAIFSPIYVTFEISEQHNTEFVGAYLMRSDFINQALRFQEGTVYERMAVSPDDLLAMQIHLPPKEKQDKLADVLSKMQMKIQAEEDVLNKTVLLKKALLSLLFI